MAKDDDAKLDPLGGGPYLNAAFFCENVLEEKDGALSPVRIVDRLIIQASGQGVPDEMPPVESRLVLLVMFKSGSARGRHEVELVMEAPSGLARPMQKQPIFFEGEDRGVNQIYRLTMTLQSEGLYWCEVRLDKRPVTRVPLRLVYQPQETLPVEAEQP